MKSNKMPYIIYADFKSLIEKIHGCEAIWKNLQQQNQLKYSLQIFNVNKWNFDNTENKYSLYHQEDCMKKCCDSFKEHATNLTNFEKKKILLLQKELKVHQNAAACYICGKRFSKTKKKVCQR